MSEKPSWTRFLIIANFFIAAAIAVITNIVASYLQTRYALTDDQGRFFLVLLLFIIALGTGLWITLRISHILTPQQIWSVNMEPVVSDDGKEMMLVPAGNFLFGDEKKPLLLGAFYIDRYPVTNAEYEAFVKATKHSPLPDHWKNGTYPLGHDNHPVVYVSWYDAQAYAQWANKELPTEQEWEKAARGIDGRGYPWGNRFDANKCNTSESQAGGTTPVDWYVSGGSCYGVMDMAGNTWDWTDSWYNPTERVRRGGSWVFDRNWARCAFRHKVRPESRHEDLGFRCTKSVLGV